MLETERLMIRSFQKNDWQDLHEYLSLSDTYIYEPGAPITIEQSKKLVKTRSKGDDFLAVVLKAENKMIGHLYFKLTEPKEFLAWELGYIFNPAYHNKGYCTEAARKIIEYGFNELKAHRINAFCDPANVASWHVLERIGMKREGYFRNKAFFRRDFNNNPIWHDCYAYGIIEGEVPPLSKRRIAGRPSAYRSR